MMRALDPIASVLGYAALAILAWPAAATLVVLACGLIGRLRSAAKDRRPRRMIAGGRLGSKRDAPLVHYWFDPGADLLCHEAFGGYCRVQEPPMAVWIRARRRGRQP